MNNTFTRFLTVGLFNTLVGLSSTFFILHILGWGYWVSTCLGNIIGAVISYLLNRKFTFRSSSKYRQSFWKFAIVILVCYFSSYWFSFFMSNLLLKSYYMQFTKDTVENIAVLGGACLYTLSNYLGHKYYTFRTVTT
ncbi:MAG TPA: GtrA family protein [Bacilli bacterium]